MLFNDFLILEILILITIFFFITNTNIMVLLYTTCIFLILIGVFSLLNDADIYIGFLWVIDLGVGLVFFIFVLHFTSFLHQKSHFNLSYRYYIFSYIFFFFFMFFVYFTAFNNNSEFYNGLSKVWFFKLTYIDYYLINFSYEITDLNTLRDTYFLLNSFEFFIVNFSLLFGLLASIFLCFIIHRIFNFLNFSQIINMSILNKLKSSFFIRNQNFSTQKNTTPAVRVWVKNKS